MKGAPRFGHGLVLALAAVSLATLGGESSDDITALSGRISRDYIRTRQTDGSFAPESYAFAKGGDWAGAMRDPSIDKLSFLDVAHTIAQPLASQNYIPSRDPNSTRLLIMVYWGTTHAPEHATDSNGYVNLQRANETVSRAQVSLKTAGDPGSYAAAREVLEQSTDEMLTALGAVAAENNLRDQENIRNVRMLGYDSWWEDTKQFEDKGFGLDYRRQDLIDEVESNRYFVVLMAYDFQLLWKHKQHKLLWETRFSIRQMHHEFDKDLPAMAQYASKYFGQDSHGLVRKEIPLGRVDIGEVKSLGEAEAPKR